MTKLLSWKQYDTGIKTETQINETGQRIQNSIHIWSINLQQGAKNIQWVRNSVWNKWYLENWTATHKIMEMNNYIIHKINSKWVKDWIHKTEIIQFQGENIGSELLDIGLGDDVLDFTEAKATKAKNKQAGPHQTKKPQPSKENHQQTEKAVYWMKENICKPYI